MWNLCSLPLELRWVFVTSCTNGMRHSEAQLIKVRQYHPGSLYLGTCGFRALSCCVRNSAALFSRPCGDQIEMEGDAEERPNDLQAAPSTSWGHVGQRWAVLSESCPNCRLGSEVRWLLRLLLRHQVLGGLLCLYVARTLLFLFPNTTSVLFSSPALSCA